LIETTRRSKKASDARPATLPTDKTDITPGTNHIYLPSRRAKTRPDPHLLSPHDISIRSSSVPPLRPYRQGSMRPHPNTRRSTRHNSYRPELDSAAAEDISCSAEEDPDSIEDTPSLTGSFGSSEDSNTRLQMARTRESCDENYSGYLLSLAAVQAEEQLRQKLLQEQALAAYPNSDFHDPVEHFYNLESDPGSDEDDGPIGLLPHEMVARKESTVSGFIAIELQEHEETLARMRAEETFRLVAEEAAKPSFADPFWTNGTTKKGLGAAAAKDEEFTVMRDAASPPMLGSDLVFRLCPSPQFTKFETDQRHEAPPAKDDHGGGLWGGYCVADDEALSVAPHDRGPALLETPSNEAADPTSHDGEGPARSPRGVQMLAGLDERLCEEAIAAEFDDAFVTQVYNYLSLGYPLLAREYDEELAHISRTPVEELRAGDDARPVGNLGFDAGGSGGTSGEGEGARTARWWALKAYVHEWARQHPDLGGERPGGWGVRERRGSWAI